MIHDPLIRVLWGLLPAGICYGLSFLPERVKIRTALSREQAWGCQDVSLVLAGVFGVNLLLLAVPFQPLRGIASGSLWPVEFLLFFSQVLYVAPVIFTVVLRKRRSLRSLGLIRSHATSLIAWATATYFLLVFLWSVQGYLGRNDWTDLYTNRIFGDLLARAPVGHSLVIVLLMGTGACVDEIIFRGFALIPISRVAGPAAGIAATALFWSMGHFADLGRTLVIFVMGLLLGWSFLRSGSLVPPLTFHLLWNLGSASDFIFGRLANASIRWTNWEHFLYVGVGSLVVGLVAVLVALLVRPRP